MWLPFCVNWSWKSRDGWLNLKTSQLCRKVVFFPTSPLHVPSAVFALFPPSPMAFNDTGAHVAPPVTLLVPGHSKRGVLGFEWKDDLKLQRLLEELGVSMATGREAGAAASGKGQQMWDRDAGGTHLVLPVGCAAHAIPQLGEVENFPISGSAVCPRQRGWDSSQPAGRPGAAVPPPGSAAGAG